MSCGMKYAQAVDGFLRIVKRKHHNRNLCTIRNAIKPLRMDSACLRVPSGAIPNQIFSLLWIISIMSWVNPWAWLRLTGMTPIHSSKGFSGVWNKLFLPKMVICRPKPSRAVKPCHASILEVCSEIIATALGKFGNSPTKRQQSANLAPNKAA